ncbi:hypothetical protein AB0A60_20150 [Streptomyces sp. NPDC046275]|uniref:hypothetical protein n=1 Tax=Streptomyces sp. NPDC046275 TaxID=3157201 RepID=UPI0033DE6F56
MEHQYLPLDLVRAQTARTATYAALAAPGLGSTRAPRRRLLRLCARLYWPRHWVAPGGGVAGLVELREHVRADRGETVMAL